MDGDWTSDPDMPMNMTSVPMWAPDEASCRAWYMALSLQQLRRHCEDSWLSDDGTQEDLVGRLVDFMMPAEGWPDQGDEVTAGVRASTTQLARPAAPESFTLHPAWAQLANPDEHAGRKLAWRRAACHEPSACAPSEKDRGGLLEILQSRASPHRLTPPLGLRGRINNYIKAGCVEEVSTAVRAQLAVTTDPWYAAAPLETVNYGGRGGAQQLWWCGPGLGWRGSPPNIHSGLKRALGSRGDGTLRHSRAKRQDRLDGPISDRDVMLLPLTEEYGLADMDLDEVSRLQELLAASAPPVQVPVSPRWRESHLDDKQGDSVSIGSAAELGEEKVGGMPIGHQSDETADMEIDTRVEEDRQAQQSDYEERSDEEQMSTAVAAAPAHQLTIPKPHPPSRPPSRPAWLQQDFMHNFQAPEPDDHDVQELLRQRETSPHLDEHLFLRSRGRVGRWTYQSTSRHGARLLTIEEEENKQEDGSDEEGSVPDRKDDDEPDQSDGGREQRLGGQDDYTAWLDDNGAEAQDKPPLMDYQHWPGGDSAATWFKMTLYACLVQFLYLFGASLNNLSLSCRKGKLETLKRRARHVCVDEARAVQIAQRLGGSPAGGKSRAAHTLPLGVCA